MVNTWIEKYKPRSSKDFPFFKNEIQTIQKWLQCFINKKISMYNFKNGLLISGPSGIGKTCLIQTLLNEMNIDVLEFNASSIDTPNDIMEKLNQVFSTTNIMSFISTKKLTCVVIDELDVINSRKEFGSSNIVEFLEYEKTKKYANQKIKKSKKLFILNKIPIICITNKLSIKHLKLHTIHIKLSPPSNYQLKCFADQILKRESNELESSILQLIISKTQFDYRRLLLMLEDICCYINENDPNKSRIFAKINSFSQKDNTGSIYEYTKSIFSHEQDINTLSKKFDSYSKPLIFLVHDNFIQYINKNCKYSYKKKIKYCKQYYKDFIDANVFLNKSFGHWYLNKYGSVLALKSVNIIIPKIKKKQTGSYLASSVILSKYNYRYYNLKYINYFSKKIDMDIRNFSKLSHLLYYMSFNNTANIRPYVKRLKTLGISTTEFTKIIKLAIMSGTMSKKNESFIKKIFENKIKTNVNKIKISNG